MRTIQIPDSLARWAAKLCRQNRMPPEDYDQFVARLIRMGIHATIASGK